MTHQPFFNPSPLYKEFMLLDVIDQETSITQRRMSSFVGASVSMINTYLDQFEEEGTVTRIYKSPKVVHYQLTETGQERLKLLNVWFLSDAQKIYFKAQENIQQFLMNVQKENIFNILLYGAGEMGQLFFHVINENFKDLKILAFIDDDPIKQKQSFLGYPVISMNEFQNKSFDGIIISSYNHHTFMRQKLLDHGIKAEDIRGYFDAKL